MRTAPRHFILGDGLIGQAVADELASTGHAPVLASRSGPKASTAHPHVRADALDGAALRTATQGCTHLYLTLGLRYDTRVWQRDWPRVMQNAIDAALAHGAVLVFFDNVYAYGPLPLQVPMREDHPREPPSRKGAVRAQLLNLIERAARTQGLRWVIGRSADFYGPGVRQSPLFVAAIERQLKGKAAQWMGKPDARHSFTYVPDAARGLVQLALDEGAWQHAWHLPTPAEAPTPRQLLTHSARLLGAPERIQVLPDALLGVLKLFMPPLREYGEMLYQNRQDYVFSSAAFMARYSDFAVTPYEEGVAWMTASFRRP
ncbi:MAG: NAD-dependent epimerase/dehydratase family protein [Pseudomonadota bacterium]|nr:NAD-dependent epimerase/dehydratase family protein [Pseudomonadota bacterium]